MKLLNDFYEFKKAELEKFPNTKEELLMSTFLKGKKILLITFYNEEMLTETVTLKMYEIIGLLEITKEHILNKNK